MTVLVLGADGFIGRHIAFGLRNAGWHVIASARRTSRLDRMGFGVLHGWRPRMVGAEQIGLVAACTAELTLLAPPYGCCVRAGC